MAGRLATDSIEQKRWLIRQLPMSSPVLDDDEPLR